MSSKLVMDMTFFCTAILCFVKIETMAKTVHHWNRANLTGMQLEIPRGDPENEEGTAENLRPNRSMQDAVNGRPKNTGVDQGIKEKLFYLLGIQH
jgi:hypothetical protein